MAQQAIVQGPCGGERAIDTASDTLALRYRFSYINRGAPPLAPICVGYGGHAGVALCLNTKLLDTDSANLRIFHSPVLYGDAEVLTAELSALLGRVRKIGDDIRAIGRERFFEIVRNALKYAVLSFKHPGFSEEAEWRMIYSLDEGESKFVAHTPVTINETPQVICEVPLANVNGLEMPELGIDQVFERIIIGPCEHPHQIRIALNKAFHDHRLKAPRIDISNIPLRHSAS